MLSLSAGSERRASASRRAVNDFVPTRLLVSTAPRDSKRRANFAPCARTECALRIDPQKRLGATLRWRAADPDLGPEDRAGHNIAANARPTAGCQRFVPPPFPVGPKG
jgi:hypothetical protein